MNREFSGRVALVVGNDTNSSREIGRRLSASGAVVAFAEHNENVTAARAVLDQLVDQHGKVDILINIPSNPIAKPIEQLTDEDLLEAMENVTGSSFRLMRMVVQSMRNQGFGRIVNVSDLDYLGAPGHIVASSAQSGIFGLTRSAALEFARDGVTVNNVVLGDIEPDSGLSKEQANALEAAIPVRRLGQATDVAYAVSYFASERSKYVTGQTFFVCGGKSIHSSMSV